MATVNNQKNKKMKIGREANILYTRGKAEKVLFGIVFALFVIYAISLLFPFFYLILNSFKGRYEYIKHLNASQTLAMPMRFEFENYVEAFVSMNMVNSIGEKVYLPVMALNSVWYTLAHVGAGILASSLTAYCLAKYTFRSRGFFHGLAIFSMTIPIIGTTGAAFKLYFQLGIYNTLLVPFIAGYSGFSMNFLILYGFFRNLSWSYAEAAFIDGAGHAKVFFGIMMPQALPSIVALAITQAIPMWNDYSTSMINLPKYPNLGYGIYKFEPGPYVQYDTAVYYSAVIISMLPPMILYAANQKFILSSLSVGGLKG